MQNTEKYLSAGVLYLPAYLPALPVYLPTCPQTYTQVRSTLIVTWCIRAKIYLHDQPQNIKKIFFNSTRERTRFAFFCYCYPSIYSYMSLYLSVYLPNYIYLYQVYLSIYLANCISLYLSIKWMFFSLQYLFTSSACMYIFPYLNITTYMRVNVWFIIPITHLSKGGM